VIGIVGVHPVEALVVGAELLEMLVVGGGWPVPQLGGGGTQLGDV